MESKDRVCQVSLVIVSSESLGELLFQIPESLGSAGSQVWSPEGGTDKCSYYYLAMTLGSIYGIVGRVILLAGIIGSDYKEKLGLLLHYGCRKM